MRLIPRLIAAFNALGTLQQTRLVAAFVLTMGILSLAFAYTAQYGFGLLPCILCLYQRWPYRITIGLAVFALIIARKSTGTALSALYLTPIAYLAGTAIALFQVGVEQGWWRGTDECVGADWTTLNVDQALEKINSAPVVRCDEIQFEFLGISMAGYNGLLSLGLAGATVIALYLIRTRR